MTNAEDPRDDLAARIRHLEAECRATLLLGAVREFWRRNLAIVEAVATGHTVQWGVKQYETGYRGRAYLEDLSETTGGFLGPAEDAPPGVSSEPPNSAPG